MVGCAAGCSRNSRPPQRRTPIFIEAQKVSQRLGSRVSMRATYIRQIDFTFVRFEVGCRRGVRRTWLRELSVSESADLLDERLPRDVGRENPLIVHPH